MHRFIKAVGAGQKRARDLTRQEAREAMQLLMAAEPVQVGAFLLALRMKGEHADELAGFADALMAGSSPAPAPPGTLDVDCHGDGHAGRSTLLPAAACALASLGIPVLLRTELANPFAKHGLAAALAELGLRADGPGAPSLASRGVAVLDVADYCPPLAKLVALRPLLGVRTVAQTLMKILAPVKTAARLIGVFHAPYLPSTAQALVKISPGPGLCVQALGGLPEAAPGKLLRVARAGESEPEMLNLRFLAAAAARTDDDAARDNLPATAARTEGDSARNNRAAAAAEAGERSARDNRAALAGEEPALTRAVAAGALMLYVARGTALPEAADAVRDALSSGRARRGYTSP